jgi:hypothetical protein
MKKKTITFTTLGLLAILSCGLVLYLSCGLTSNCKDCPQLSNEELSFFCYNTGDEVVFKNDITNVFDTLTIKVKATNSTGCSDPCDGPNGSIVVNFTFLHLLKSGGMDIQGHNKTPEISLGGTTHNVYNFPLSGKTQTVNVNGTAYNDIYSVQVDSTTIVSQDRQSVPWKIYYSKSNGFVRFFMVNGQTWSKL